MGVLGYGGGSVKCCVCLDFVFMFEVCIVGFYWLVKLLWFFLVSVSVMLIEKVVFVFFIGYC